MHPSEFFKQCAIRTGIDVFEIFDNDIKEKMMNIHPRNFIKSKITHPIYEISVSYETDRGNYKESTKYMILDNEPEEEYADFWADIFSRDYETEYKNSIKNIRILGVKYIGDAVLKIG